MRYGDLVPYWQSKRNPIKGRKKNAEAHDAMQGFIALRYSQPLDDKSESTKTVVWKKCKEVICITYSFNLLQS